MSQNVAGKPKQEVPQYTRFDILGVQQQPVLPGFEKCVAVFAQVDAQKLQNKLAEKIDADIKISRRSQGFNNLERLCEEVIDEGKSSTITGFIIARRGDDCVQFCCLVDGHPSSFPLRSNLTAVCD